MYLHLAWQASIHPLFYRGQYFVKHLSKYINYVVSSPFVVHLVVSQSKSILVWFGFLLLFWEKLFLIT